MKWWKYLLILAMGLMIVGAVTYVIKLVEITDGPTGEPPVLSSSVGRWNST